MPAVRTESIDALSALFSNKDWGNKLPHLSVLQKDPEARVLLDPPHSLSRNQIKYQFVIWRRSGRQLNATAREVSDDQIIATVDNRVGSVPMLLQRTFAAVFRGPLRGCRPSFMPEVLHSLEFNKDCSAFLESRVAELKGFVVENFARRASNVRSHSLAFEVAINKSRSRRKKEWIGQARPAYVTTAFFSVFTLDADVLVADNVDHLIRLTFDFIDTELCAQFRKSFGPKSITGALAIPEFPDNEPKNELVQQTICYIAGGALSALQKASTACENSDPTRSSLFTSFVAKHSITKKSAEVSGVPIRLIVARSNGSLIFPSHEVYSLVVLIEHAFSNLLTMENVLAFGGKIISEVYRLTRESKAIKAAFDTCMAPVREVARAAGYTGVNGAPLLEKVLKLYMRIRGKDAVKTLVSDLKQSALANSTRGRLAATASASARRRGSKRTSSEIASELSGEFDAVDMDLAEVTEEFSLEPNSTPNKGTSSEIVSDISDELDAVDMDLAEVTEELSLEPNSTHDAVALTLPGPEGGACSAASPATTTKPIWKGFSV